MILVTGCPRSGTGSAAKTLQLLGLDVQHEKEGKHGTADWRIWNHQIPSLETDLWSRPKRYDVIIGLVRHPRDWLSSMQTIGEAACRSINDFMGIIHRTECLPAPELLLRYWMKRWKWLELYADSITQTEKLPVIVNQRPQQAMPRLEGDASWLFDAALGIYNLLGKWNENNTLAE